MGDVLIDLYLELESWFCEGMNNTKKFNVSSILLVNCSLNIPIESTYKYVQSLNGKLKWILRLSTLLATMGTRSDFQIEKLFESS
jgi:hypothetical protein